MAKNVVELIITGKDLSAKELAKVDKNLDNLGKSMQKVGAVAIGVGTALAASLSGAVAKIVSYGDSVAEASDKTGVSTETVQTLGFAMERMGGDFSDTFMAIKKLSGAMVDAKAGNEDSVAMFDKLHVSVYRTDGTLKSFEEILPEVADAFSKVTNVTERVALSTDLFGKAGMRLIPILKDGRAGLEEISEKAHKLGVVLDKDTVEAAHNLDHAMFDMKKSISGAVYALGEQLLPVAQKFTEKVVGVVVEIRKWIEEHPKLAERLLELSGILVVGGALLVGIGTLIRLCNSAAISITALKIATLSLGKGFIALVAVLNGPVGLIALVAALGVGIYLTAKKAKEAAIEEMKGVEKVATESLDRMNNQFAEFAANRARAKGTFIGLSGQELEDMVTKEIAAFKAKPAKSTVPVGFHIVPADDALFKKMADSIAPIVPYIEKTEEDVEEILAEPFVFVTEEAAKILADIEKFTSMVTESLWFGINSLFRRILVGTESFHGAFKAMWRMLADMVIAEVARMVAAWVAAQLKMLAIKAFFAVVNFLLPSPAGVDTGMAVGGVPAATGGVVSTSRGAVVERGGLFAERGGVVSGVRQSVFSTMALAAQYGGVITVGSKVMDTVPVTARKGEAFLDTELTDKLREFIEKPVQQITQIAINAGVVNTTRGEETRMATTIRQALETYSKFMVVKGTV